ncbi:hypothetical protein HN51_043826 [Arachis hypogaea]
MSASSDSDLLSKLHVGRASRLWSCRFRLCILLQLDLFLNELTSMFEQSTETGSVWVTLEDVLFFRKVSSNSLFFLFMFLVGLLASLKSQAVRN